MQHVCTAEYLLNTGVFLSGNPSLSLIVYTVPVVLYASALPVALPNALRNFIAFEVIVLYFNRVILSPDETPPCLAY